MNYGHRCPVETALREVINFLKNQNKIMDKMEVALNESKDSYEKEVNKMKKKLKK